MTRRYSTITGPPTPPPTDRTIADTVELGPRRRLEAGDEVTITGRRGGRFRFVAYVTTDSGAEWVDVYGPVTGARQMSRSFDVERIGTIHRKPKGRA